MGLCVGNGMEGTGVEWSGGEGKVGRGFSRYYDLCVKSEEKLL